MPTEKSLAILYKTNKQTNKQTKKTPKCFVLVSSLYVHLLKIKFTDGKQKNNTKKQTNKQTNKQQQQQKKTQMKFKNHS